jgi:uncharacterized protein
MNDATMVQPWWREPIMWLVVGGPAAVVVAGITTAAIAMHRPDPVLKAEATKPPALQARNHAATPRAVPPIAKP